MGLKNEAQSAIRDTRSFYRQYVSDMTRERLGKEFQADSERLKELYHEAILSKYQENELSGIQKFYRFFSAMTQRLNPTRRLVFGISCISFVSHYFFSLTGLTGFIFYPLLMPAAFIGVNILLLIELLEKADVKRELDLAREIQLGLMPVTQYSDDSLEAYSFAATAHEVGGDYVDVIPSKNGTYVIIADVAGKGLSAALYMVRIQAMVHLLIKMKEPTPKDLFLELNDYIKSDKKDKTFITSCAAYFPKGENFYLFARAGHNQPIQYSKEHDQTFELKTDGFALGMTNRNALKKQMTEKKFAFKPGDSILFYTDGLTEARNEIGEEFGIERIDSILSIYGSLHAKSISLKIQSSIETFIGNVDPADDITYTCIHKPFA
ncbi:MAG: PP2C family protein-serine/threonine phosphatase [Balneolaceae bacterium]